MEHTVENFINELAGEGRILLIGGLAVIAHGLSRATKDADIWFEPFDNEQIWADKVNKICGKFKNAKLFDVFENNTIPTEMLVEHINDKLMVRISGLERPLDIFRIPHNMKLKDFDPAWNFSDMYLKKMKVMDEICLLFTKEETDRKIDDSDLTFLKATINSKIEPILKTADYKRVKEIFERYADIKSCKAALENPDIKVRELSMEILNLLADGGDMFAIDLLERIRNE